MSKTARDAFERIAINEDPVASRTIIEALKQRGLIFQVGVQQFKDQFGTR